MQDNWLSYYSGDGKDASVLVPESFVARFFLSRRPVTFMHEYDFQGRTVLDIGCGSGRHLNFFLDLGLKLTGVDIMIAQVSSTVASRVKLVEGSFQNFPNFEKQFDFVTCVNSIYYCKSERELEANLGIVYDNLKPGGFALLSFIGDAHFVIADDLKPHQFTYEIRTDPSRHQCGVNKIFIPRDTGSAHELLERAGFQHDSILVGQQRDELNGFCRHLYYVYAAKV